MVVESSAAVKRQPSASGTAPKGATRMSKSINRSASTGRFVSRATAARWPGRTTTERVGPGTGNTRTVSRSAATGRFVTEQTAKRNPGGTISQQV